MYSTVEIVYLKQSCPLRAVQGLSYTLYEHFRLLRSWSVIIQSKRNIPVLECRAQYRWLLFITKFEGTTFWIPEAVDGMDLFRSTQLEFYGSATFDG
jgi:hypothetical protein